MKTIIHVAHMRASPPQVYDALTTAERLSQWWTTQVAVDAGTGGIIRLANWRRFLQILRPMA